MFDLSFDRATMKFTWERLDEDENSTIVLFPAVFEVCHRCGGTGSHINPSIDGDGFTGSEWAEMGCEFQEDYMSGAFDVTCEECKGQNVVPTLDEERCDKEALAAYEKVCDEEALYQSICESERRMGC